MSSMESKNRRSLVVAALLVIAGVGMLATLQPRARVAAIGAGERVPEVSTEQSFALEGAVAARIRSSEAGTALAGQGLRRGDLLEYRFSQERSVFFQALELPTESGPAESPSAELVMSSRGSFSAYVYTEHARGLDVGFSAQQVEVDFRSRELQETAGGIEGLEEDVASGEVLARLSPQGRVERLVFPADMGADARNYWRDTLARWQVVLPDPERASDHWTAEEVDGTGTYVARYRVIEPGSPRRLSKTKVSYVAVHGATAESDLALPSGAATILLDSCLFSLEGHEEVVIETPGFAKRIQTAIDYTFERVTLEHAPRPTQPDLAALDRAEATTLAEMERGLGEEEGEAASPLTTEELLEQIELALDAEGRRSKTVFGLMRRLVQRMRDDPEAVGAALSRLATDPCSNDLAAVLIGAFGGAGTPAAQLALQQILTAPGWGEDRQNMALLSFTQVTSPGPSIDAALFELHRGGQRLAYASLYLLGTVGRQVAGSDAPRFLAIQDYLLSLAQAGHDLGERLSALQALSNLGPAQVFAEIELAFDDPNEELRRASLQALTRCFDPSADQILEAAVLTDPAADVRLEAVEALDSPQRPRAADLLQTVVREDSSDEVRLAAVKALAGSFGKLSTTRRTLSEVARSDRSPDVAGYARRIVASY